MKIEQLMVLHNGGGVSPFEYCATCTYTHGGSPQQAKLPPIIGFIGSGFFPGKPILKSGGH